MKTIQRLFILAVLMVGPGVAMTLYAPPPNPSPPAAGAPIDAMVGILLVISLVFGMKHLLAKGK